MQNFMPSTGEWLALAAVFVFVGILIGLLV
jgi:hypothetical protein